MPKNEPDQGVWTSKFASGSTEQLEDGLAAVLAMQASRVQAMMDDQDKLPADTSAADRIKYSTEVDKQLDKVFKNGMSLLGAKKPRPVNPRAPKAVEAKVIDATERKELDPPTIAQAMKDLEAAGIPRANITLSDIDRFVNGDDQKALPSGQDIF